MLARELPREAGDSEEDDGHRWMVTVDAVRTTFVTVMRDTSYFSFLLALLRPANERGDSSVWRRRSERRRRRASHARGAGGCHRDSARASRAATSTPTRSGTALRHPSPTRGETRFARDCGANSRGAAAGSVPSVMHDRPAVPRPDDGCRSARSPGDAHGVFERGARSTPSRSRSSGPQLLLGEMRSGRSQPAPARHRK